jgi:hypothetical protein
VVKPAIQKLIEPPSPRFLGFFLFQARSFDNKALKKVKPIAAPDALIRVKGGDPRANRIKPKNFSEDK